MDNRTAIDYMNELEDVVRDRQGPTAKAFDVYVAWYRNDGFLYSHDGFYMTREQAIARLDMWIQRRNNHQEPSTSVPSM